jgi:hypothetical protein
MSSFFIEESKNNYRGDEMPEIIIFFFVASNKYAAPLPMPSPVKARLRINRQMEQFLLYPFINYSHLQLLFK